MEPTGRANARPMTGSAQSGIAMLTDGPRISLRSIRATIVSARSQLDTLAPHSVNRGLWRGVFSDPRPIYRPLIGSQKFRTHSSAGERSLHTGEVQGSIPCASTIFKGFLSPLALFPQ